MEAADSDLETFRELLLSGEVLCELLNSCTGSARDSAEKLPVPSYRTGQLSRFMQMDNVTKFLRACREFFKMPEHQLFCTVDLTEGRDLQAVVSCLVALSGRLQP